MEIHMKLTIKHIFVGLLAFSFASCSSPESVSTPVSIQSETNSPVTSVNSPKGSNSGMATYLGNEAVMVEHKGNKVLFDPFFHNGFDIYQTVPEDIREAIFSGTAPYDKIDAIFISHAHADHFSADDLVDFMLAHSNTQLVAPAQAIDAILELEEFEDISTIKARLHPISLAYQDAPVELKLGDITVDAVRIPHAGWPQRAEVSNIVFRVSLSDEVTVVHMGDADVNDEHYKPLMAHWKKQQTDTAFPPYWFFLSETGQFILTDRIKADENVGIHVPIKVPSDLVETGKQYFSKPGETLSIGSE